MRNIELPVATEKTEFVKADRHRTGVRVIMISVQRLLWLLRLRRLFCLLCLQRCREDEPSEHCRIQTNWTFESHRVPFRGGSVNKSSSGKG